MRPRRATLSHSTRNPGLGDPLLPKGERVMPRLWRPAFLRSRASVTLALLLAVKGSRIESAGVATMQKSRRPSSLGRHRAATLGNRLTAPRAGYLLTASARHWTQISACVREPPRRQIGEDTI